MSRPCLVCQADNTAFLCKPCLGEVRRAIAEMPSLRHEISMLATGQTKVYRANGRPDPNTDIEAWDAEEKRIPSWLRSKQGRVTLPTTAGMVNLHARDLLTEADTALIGWARHLAESRGIELAVTDRTQLDGWLLTNVDTIRWDEAAGEMHTELTRLQHRMTRAVDRAPSRRDAGPCHAPLTDNTRCQRRLYAWPGAEEIICDGYRPAADLEVSYDVGCGARHSETDRDDHLRESLTTALVTIPELLDALPKLFPGYPRPGRGVAQSWVTNGRIFKRGTNHVGEDLFLGSELLHLVETYRPRGYAPRPNRRKMSA
jgi:hypothetical protein